jgi:ubiquinone/menaquinone biosynthesis C-methylase UbiE
LRFWLRKTTGDCRQFTRFIEIYDDGFFDFYPYLKGYFDQLELEEHSVCEIGLGYGTASSFLAEKSASYHGVDIAQGPVDMVNKRLEYLGKPQAARLGSCHKLDFSDNSLNNVVSIGCFHHTGSIQKCVDEAFRVLKPGGRLLFMCYNRKSMRMLKQLRFDLFFSASDPVRLSDNKASLYDVNAKGEPAPYTELSSKKYFREICKEFSNVRITAENWDGNYRKYFLNNVAHFLGLDLYVIAQK